MEEHGGGVRAGLSRHPHHRREVRTCGAGAVRGECRFFSKKAIAVAVAIRYGKVCAECFSERRCHKPTGNGDHINLPCLTCDGNGSVGFDTNGDIPCSRCEGRRLDPEPLQTCPFDIITPDVWRVIKYAEHARKGRWPVNGGVMDQAKQFVDVCELIWGMEREYRAKRHPLEVLMQDD